MLGSLWFNSFSSGAGASADYELISTTILGSSAAAVTFTDAGAWAPYKHLQIRGAARSDVAAHYVDTRLKVNGDTTTANYSTYELYGAGSGAAAAGGANPYYPPGIVYSAGSSAATYNFGAFVIDVLDFANTSKGKTFKALSGVTSGSNLIDMRSVNWFSTAAITSIELNTSSNFITGSRFSLYGLKG